MEYGNTIANLGCSILKYFGAETINPTLKAADALLEKHYKNVVVYRNTDDEGNPIDEANIAWKYYPYPRIINQLEKLGIEAYDVSPFGKVQADSFEEICDHRAITR